MGRVLLGILFLSLSWLVHVDFALGVHVNTEADGVPVEVVDGVEVLEESVADEEQVLVLSWQSALVDNEVALLVARFVEVLLWVYLEDIVAHLETNWLDLWSNIFTALLHVTESLVRCAVEVWQCLCPLRSDFLEDIWWDGQLGGTSIDNCWVRSILSWLLHGFATVEHTLTLESPGTEPVLEILESFETFGTADDLGRVISSEKSIGRLTHLSRGDTEADHGSVNDLVILKRPEVVKLLLFHIFVWRQTENTIRVVSKSLRLIKSQELEECALIILQINFKLLR